MKSNIDLSKKEWDFVWYWVTCYECPDTDVCTDIKLCDSCKLVESIQKKSRGLKQ